MKYHLVTDMEQPQKASLPSIKTRPRQPIGLPRLLLAIGGQAPKAIRSVEGFDFTQQKWVQVSEMQTRRYMIFSKAYSHTDLSLHVSVLFL